MAEQGDKITDEQRRRLWQLRVDSKMGRPLTREEQSFCEEMFRRFPDDYPKDADIFRTVRKYVNPMAGDE